MYQNYQTGTFTGDVLAGHTHQAATFIQMRAILHHRATATTTFEGLYPQGENLEETARIEHHEMLLRYVLGPNSTIDGDPLACFRHLNGMQGGIKVAFAGFSFTDFLPKMTTDDSINVTADIDVHIGGVGPGFYNGNKVARMHSPIYIKQSPPSMCNTKTLMRRRQKGQDTAVIQPRMYPVDAVRATYALPMTDRLIESLREAIQEIRGEGKGLSPSRAMREFRQNVEQGLPNNSPIRRHLAHAGVELERCEEDEDTPPAANTRNPVKLGDQFVIDVESACQETFEQARLAEDPIAGLQEILKVVMYLTDRVIRARKPGIHDTNVYTRTLLVQNLQLILTKYFGYTLEQELFHREYSYIGKVLQECHPQNLEALFHIFT